MRVFFPLLKIIALDPDKAEVHEECMAFLLYLCLIYEGYEVCSETAGVASHVPASKTNQLMLRVVKQLVLHHMFQGTST